MIKLRFCKEEYKVVGSNTYCFITCKLIIPSYFEKIGLDDSAKKLVNTGLSEILYDSEVSELDIFGVSGCADFTVTGKAIINPKDEFDKSRGRKISHSDARRQAYSKAKKCIDLLMCSIPTEYFEVGKIINELDNRSSFMKYLKDKEYDFMCKEKLGKNEEGN